MNFSAGAQSSALLWMVILGEIERPKNFLVLHADPGMENSETYEYLEYIRPFAEEAGCPIITVGGPDLYEDLVGLAETDKTRFDNPPYWTLNQGGSVGRLRQKCTQIYKIAPMDRYLRIYLEEHHGISRKSKRIGEGVVQKWIGFGADETHRVKPSKQKYVAFDYPLIRLGFTRAKLEEWYVDRDLPRPPRSVCNACFANGLETFKEMYKNRPDDWEKACKVDDSVRDWGQIGIDDEVFVSRSMTPLRRLPMVNFNPGGEEQPEVWSCDSGHCFL